MFVGKLRPFQIPAKKRMVKRRRVLVAYEMGLGKTPITINTIETLLEKGKVECGLIVAEASLKYQWLRQINQFSDCARVLVIDGDPAKRRKQYLRAMKGLYEYIILSYDNIVRDFEQVEKIPIDYMVLDEATKIKGLRSERSKKVKQIRPKYRFALTGQPIENRPEELFSIMQWVDPKVLGNFLEFEKTFIKRVGSTGKVQRYRNLPLLHKLLGDAMVRATWEDPDVRDQMPKVVEECCYIDFDRGGQTMYNKIATELLALLRSIPGGAKFNIFAHYGYADPVQLQMRGDIMARMTALQMLCDHPDLLSLSADTYEKTQHDRKHKGSKYCYELNKKGVFKTKASSPKLDETVTQIVDMLNASPKNKVVLFSKHPAMLRRIADATAKYTNSTMLIGKMKPMERDAAIHKFQTDRNTRLFLSSDAGGYGVDLPQANYLINYDLPYSSGKLRQRNARIVRLSSEFDNVTVVNMLMTSSIEERIYDMLVEKHAIAAAWIDGKGVDRKGALELTLSTLTEFLEQTALPTAA
jgi:SNF2 family DNA or RNA helicase